MTTKYIPLPPNNTGGLLFTYNSSTLGLITVLPPHPVSVPLKMSREGVRTAIEDYFCHDCKFRLNFNDKQVTADYNPTELSAYCREREKCPGSKRFATPKCLAGFNQESDMFRVANAEFTTPYIGLETHYKLSSKGTFTSPQHYWRCFKDEKLTYSQVYNNFNVFVHGNTCWGARGTPKDPASAYNEFFNSLTNSDLSNLNGHSLKYAIENWKPREDDWESTMERYPANRILAKTLVDPDHPLTGVIISNNANWVDSVPETELVTLGRNNDYFVGWVRETSTGAQVICSKKLVLMIDNLNSKTKKPMLLGRRKEFNF